MQPEKDMTTAHNPVRSSQARDDFPLVSDQRDSIQIEIHAVPRTVTEARKFATAAIAQLRTESELANLDEETFIELHADIEAALIKVWAAGRIRRKTARGLRRSMRDIRLSLKNLGEIHQQGGDNA